jgi:ribosome assembly protein 1
MDSPGHVDFSSEVSSALRLSDGAVVLVDVVEGVSAQTHTVLRQAFDEKVKTCLVLNKLDKLMIDGHMDALEIYHHLNQIIEQVNSIVAELISKEHLTSTSAKE